ncbi:Prostaglandin E synthase 2, variant 2 [Balamuthia mandrillaris]
MRNGSTKMLMATTNVSRASRTAVGSRLPSCASSSLASSGRTPFTLAIRSLSLSPVSLPQSGAAALRAASQRGVAASFRAAPPLLARSRRPFCAPPLLPQRRFLSTSSKNFRELESVAVAEKKDIWKHAWPFLIIATAFATYMIRGNKFEAKKPKPKTAFKMKSNELPKVTLFQLEHSPTTKQVRAMMDYNGIPYEVKELNPVSRRQLSFLERDRKAVILPLAIIGETQVETAREIMELLENVLSIKEAARLANQQLEASSSQEQNTTNENAEEQPSSKQRMRQHLFHKYFQELKTKNAQKREKELGLIQRVEAQLLPLISVNRFTTWKQSRLAIRSIKEVPIF